MILNFLKFLGTVCLLSTFWSGLRVASISLFEWVALLYVAFGLLRRPEPATAEMPAGLEPFKLVIAGICVLALSGIVSAPGSFDMNESLVKAAKLVAAFMLVFGVGYVSATRRLFTLQQVLRLLMMSAAFCSLIAIMQGQFGKFMMFVPTDFVGAGGGRMTGLTEHPIEMGLVSAYGVAIALGLAMQSRKWWVATMAIALNAYSMRFSASITAVAALVVAVIAVCLYTRNFKALLAGGVIACLATALVIASGSRSALLLDRIKMLASSGGGYTTVQSREAQLGYVLSHISAGTIFVGNGYSESDLPYKMEIHNGVLASVYHFGVLGLLAQMLIIGFFLSRLSGASERLQKSALVGCVVVFALGYLTGPAQARPTVWASPLFLAALLLPRRSVEVAAAGRVYGGLSEPVQPGT